MLISGFFTKTITGFFLFLDAVVYNFITYFYEIFNFLARLNLFNDEDYMAIVQRIYVILGVVMLFVLAYSLLKAIINPDDFAKGEASFPNLIKNVIVSLIIIAVLPTVFTVAYKIQNAVLYSEVIGKVILGNMGQSNKEALDNGGITIAYNTFHAFFTKGSDIIDEETIKVDQAWFDFSESMSLKEANEKVLNKESDFFIYTLFSGAADDGKVNYSIVISTVAGLFVLWSIISYCFDLGIRVIKLLFYQIIAPIPVICRILPGGKSKDIFSKWVKSTISTFMEVFVRVAIMYLGVYLISLVIKKFEDASINTGSLDSLQILLVIAFLIMGIIAFVRQAPKLIQDIFGFEMGGAGLGLKNMKERLSKGGAFAIGAGVGGLATAGTRNMVKAWGANKGEGFGRVFKTLKSGIGGAASGGLRGLYGGRSAAGFGDMKKSASASANKATEAARKREAYKASHPTIYNADGSVDGGILNGKWDDLKQNIGSWAGAGNLNIDALKSEQEVYTEGMGFKKRLFDLVADNEKVLAYQGAKKAAQEKDVEDYVKTIISDGTGCYTETLNGKPVYITTGEKDKNGNDILIKNAQAAAIELKSRDIKKYDDAIKLASLQAIDAKLKSGDGRFTGEFEAFKVFKGQHSDNETVKSMSILEELDSNQQAIISGALSTNDANVIAQTIKDMEADKGILANDKAFKIKNGDVQMEISKKVQEQKAKKE
ncbi:MAG: hypothetical protein RR325_04505 [Bacilli bacterium]